MRNPEILHNEICQRLDTIIRILETQLASAQSESGPSLDQLSGEEYEIANAALEENEKVREVVFIALSHRIISRGKACELLNIDRCDLDEWIAKAALEVKP